MSRWSVFSAVLCPSPLRRTLQDVSCVRLSRDVSVFQFEPCRTGGVSDVQRVAHVQWICLRVKVYLSLAHGRVQCGLSSCCFGCLLALSECKGLSGGTRVQNVLAFVSRTWCLLTRVHVFDPLCIRFNASVKRTCFKWTSIACSKHGHRLHPLFGFWCVLK